MFFVTLCLTVVLFDTVFSGPCGLSRFPKVYLAEKITDCLKEIPGSQDELNKYIDTIIQYVKNTPYQFLFKGKPDDFPAFDLEAELSGLKGKISTYTDKHYLEFYEEVYNIIFKLRDAHAQITFPFLSNFLYAWPYTVASFTDSESDFLTPKFKLIGHTTNIAVTENYKKDINPQDLTNKVFTHIALKEPTGPDSYVEAYKAISAFARERDYSGYDPHGQYNSILSQGLSLFPAGRMFRPNEVYNPKIFLQNRDSSGNPLETFEMHWLGIYTGNDNTASLDALNPKIASVNNNPDITSSANDTDYESTSASASSTSSFSSFTSLTSSPSFSPSPSASSSFFTSFLSVITRPFRSLIKTDTSTSTHLSKKEKARLRKELDQILSQPPPLEQVLPPAILEYDRMVEALGGQKYARREENYTSTMIDKEFKKMLKKRRNLNSTTKLPRLLAEDPPANPPDVALTELWKSADSSTSVYVDEANKIGVVRYASFSQQDYASGFLNDFGKAYRQMVDKGVKDVILDVRGNGGGYVFIAEIMIDFFFHDTIYPCDFDFDYVKNNLNGEVAKQVDAGTVVYRLGTMDTVTGFYDDGTNTKEHKNVVTNPESTFTVNYTKRFVFNQRKDAADLLAKGYGNGEKQYSPFSAEHFYVVTNGACYSCCGIMTKQIVEMKAARVLGYGKSPDDDTDINSYAPGSCAGSLMTSATVDGLRGMIQKMLLSINTDKLPSQFPRSGAGIGYTDMEFFSRNPAHANDTLYFANASVQDILPFVTSCVDGSKENLQEIAQVIRDVYIRNPNFCFPGEVRIDESCSTEATVGAHQLWGFPCKVDEENWDNYFDNTQCAFAFCNPDSFLASKRAGPADPAPEGVDTSAAIYRDTGSVTCQLIPEGRTPNQLPPKSNKVIIIVIIVLAVVLAPVLIVGLVVYFCCCRKKSS